MELLPYYPLATVLHLLTQNLLFDVDVCKETQKELTHTLDELLSGGGIYPRGLYLESYLCWQIEGLISGGAGREL